jgi:expansin (peptidoglycan-binding protein)
MRAPLVALVSLALAAPSVASEIGCPAHTVQEEAIATYYEPPGGYEGACSLPIAPGERFVAIASANYAGSAACGRCLRVTGPEGSVDVRVADECPTCGAGQLDFGGEATFDLIGDPLQGIIPIAWETIACDVGADTMKLQFEGSNPFYLKVQVQNHRHGIAGVEVWSGTTWLAMERSPDDHFVEVGAGPYPDPLLFRIADQNGQVVATNGVALVNDVAQDSGVQLEPCPEAAAALGAAAALAALRAAARRAPRRGIRRRSV